MKRSDDRAASLQWAIDRQKADYADIRNSLRAYFVLIVPIVVASIATFYERGFGISRQAMAKSLAQNGILWQTSVLPDMSATIFAETFTMFVALFWGAGAGLLGQSLLGVVKVELSQRCYPIGDSSELLRKNKGRCKLGHWIEQNDRIIRQIDNGRSNVLRIGKHGTVLLLASVGLLLIGESIAVAGVLVLIAGCVYFWDTFQYDEVIRGSLLGIAFTSAFIFVAMIAPLQGYQEAYDYFDRTYTILYSVVVLLVAAFFSRDHLWSLFRNR